MTNECDAYSSNYAFFAIANGNRAIENVARERASWVE